MKNLMLAIGFILSGVVGYSQIQYLRYNDDFSYLQSDSLPKKGLQKLKYIPIAEQVYISVGGEIREQLQRYNNFNFGDVPPNYQRSNSWQLWHRLMVHANVDIGKRARVFVQLGSTYRFLNPNPLTPEIDQNELSLHQAFIDYRFNKLWMARIGRQEVSYGSHRLITFREGPNTRLTFDGAILKYNNCKRRVDVFAISPVISQKGVFDDQSLKDLTAGIYASEKLAKKLSIDYYLLHFHSSRRKYNFVAGADNREIAGIRIFSENPKTNYEVEGTYQFGKFNQLSVNAYGISADLNHKILSKKNLIIGLAGNYLTGDNSRTDGQLNTYNLLYSKPQYGLTAPIGATNMVTMNPYLRINPIRKSNVYVAANFMWRESNQDGTYSPGAIEVRPNLENLVASSEKLLGTLLVLETAYKINSNFSIAVDASKFFAGKYVKQTGAGKDITYYSFKASFKF